MPQKPILHGRDQRPGGADPAITGPWHKTGSAGEPTFAGTWSGLVWFKLVVGPTGHLQQSLELIVKVDGGTAGTTIITLPSGYYDWADGENIPVNGQDTSGAFRACYIDGLKGDLVDGPAP